MLTPTPTRGGPSHNNNSSYHPAQTADADGYMCAVCGYSVLHSHPQMLIECHYCAQWFHRACVHISERDASQIVKYACYSCSSGDNKLGDGGGAVSAYLADPHQQQQQQSMAAGSVYDNNNNNNEYKFVSDRSTENTSNRRSAGVNLYKKNTDEFRRALTSGFYAKSGVRVLQPQDFTSGYFKVHPPSCEEPILISGDNWIIANLREPLPSLGAKEISALLARGCPMRSVDVESQESFNLSPTGWNTRLADAKTTPVNAHFRVQDTSFRHRIAAPVAVSEVDWHFAVPRSQVAGSNASSPSTSPSSSSSNSQPLTSNPDTFGTFVGAGSFQDFTVSPGGKCAWLSVSEGDVSVLLIPPTEDNLRVFADWKRSSDPPASRVFLAEHVDHCIRCVVSKTSTLFIPSGWMYALFSEQGCAFYSGFFSMTVSLFGQLRVLEMEASDDQHHQLSQSQVKYSALATGWQLSDAVPELWAALCFYVRKFLVPDPSAPHVSEPDKHALVRALPYLRRWSSSTRAIKTSDAAVWTPGSLSEAQDILDRLEQALSNAMGVTPLRSMTSTNVGSPFDQQRYPSLPMMGEAGIQGSMNNRQLQQQQQLSVSEAEYLYGRAGGDPTLSWPLTDASSSVQPVSGFQDMHSLWHYASPEQSQLPFYPSDLSNDFAAPVGHSSIGGGVATNFTFSLPTQAGGGFQHHSHHGVGNDMYMDAMRQQLLGPTLPVPSAAHQQQHSHSSFESVLTSSSSSFGVGVSGSQDVLVRHRASCHRCGNLRKKNVRCPQCPHIFCQKCAEKMVEEHGDGIFNDGCPVCKEQCCCGKNRTILCTRKFHCYKKCPSTKKPSM